MSRRLFRYHPTIGHTFIPGLRTRVSHEGGGYLVRTNEGGWRCDREPMSAKPPGVSRILAFGDSFTAGDGVSNPDRFTDILERTLPATEVYNYGIPGTGTDQQFLAWQEATPGVEHDLLVLAVYVENVRRVGARYRAYYDEDQREAIYAKPWFRLDGDGLTLEGVPVPREPREWDAIPEAERAFVERGGERYATLRRVVRSLGLRDVAQKVTGYQSLPEYDDPRDASWLTMRAILLEWIRLSPTPVLLVPIPLHTYIEETSDASACGERFRSLAKDADCAIHDPLQDLRAYAPAQRRAFRFPTDQHFTRAGHTALARSLAPAVEAAVGGRSV